MCRAIISSSLVGITHAATALEAELMRGPPSRLAASSSDMRTLLASEEPRARLAIELFTYRIGRELGSLAAATQGLDALVFTAGIGEHAAANRERVCRAAAWLGVTLDEAANRDGGPRISAASSAVAVWVIPTNEELMIARHTREALGDPA